MNTTRIEETYHGFHIHGQLLDGTGDYTSWIFSVDDQNNRRQFTLKSKVTGSAVLQNTIEVARDIGLHRSRGMIDLRQYDQGNEYEHVISTLSPQPPEVSDEQVRQLLLKALYNIYRTQPTRARVEYIDVEGFCQVVGISKSSYEFNAAVLKDKGYIDESPIQQLNISNGGIYISPSGIDIVETSVQARTHDTPFRAEKDRQALSLRSNHPLLSKDAIKLLSVMCEVAMRDDVYNLLCVDTYSRSVGRYDYQIHGVPELEALCAEDITGGAMDELREANFVRKIRENTYLLLRDGLEWLQAERNKQQRKQILEAVTGLQKEKGESYVEDTSVASKLGLELEDTQDYLEVMSREGYLEIARTLGGLRVTLSSQGRMALKNPQFISTLHQAPNSTKTQPSTAVLGSIQPPDGHITKILFLTANPSDTGWIRLDAEIRAIDQALRMAKFRDEFDIKQHRAVQVADLQDLLLRHEPDIVHFSGHGSDKGEIVLEDNSGNSHYVSTTALAQTFSLLKGNIRCVVLNACYSEAQAHAIAQHVDYVIGMSEAIGDEQSISFSKAFYRALGYGRDIQSAFALGRNEINIQNLNGEEVPKLITNKANPS
jgi:hypothetical protein